MPPTVPWLAVVVELRTLLIDASEVDDDNDSAARLILLKLAADLCVGLRCRS